MRARDLIAKLQAAVAEHGDQEVVLVFGLASGPCESVGCLSKMDWATRKDAGEVVIVVEAREQP
jgi:hypothetical protein